MSQTITKTSRLGWTIWALAALFYMYENILQVSQSVMVNELMHDLNITAALLGQLGSFYLWAYALIQIPAGMLLDNFSTRKLLTGATLFCALGCFAYTMAHSIWLAGAGRFMIGIGSGFAALGGLQLAASWFPANRFALLTGLLLSFGMLGQITGEAPLSYLVDVYSWRSTIFWLGIIGLAVALLIVAVVRDHPAEQTIKSKNQETLHDLLPNLRKVLANRQVWTIATFSMLMFTPVLVLSNLWGVQFVIKIYHIHQDVAASVLSMILVGFALGAPAFGWFSDTIRRRRPPLIIGALGALVSISAIIYLHHVPLSMFSTLMFTTGFFLSGFLPGFSIMKEINEQKVRVTAMGFMNTVNMLGGAICLPVVGYLLDTFWSGELLHNVPVYSLADYRQSLSILPIFLLIAALHLPFIRETHCENLVD